MESENLIQLFKIKSVNEMTEEELISTGLTCVPTLVIIQGQTRNVIEGQDTFNWVNSIVNNRRQTMAMNASMMHTQKLIQIEQAKKRLNEGLYGYCHAESQGISDSYSYWKDDIQQDINTAQPKSFMPLGHDERYSILTINNEAERKLTPNEQKEIAKSIAAMREQQDTSMKQVMDQQQLAYLNNAK